MGWPPTLTVGWLAKRLRARSLLRGKRDLRRIPSPRFRAANLASPSYIGWIPNVAGRLSFSHIGQTRHPSSCRTLNEDDSVRRLVICVQDRALSDALVSGAYFKFVYGFDPKWTFALVGYSEPDGRDKRAKLSGKIYIFNRTRWMNAVGSQRSGEDLIEQLMDAASSVIDEPGSIDTLIAGPLAIIEEQLRSSAVYVCDCKLDRNGIAKLSEEARAEGLIFTPAVTQPARSLDQSAQRYFCNQAYFFLKDISHNHRHHHAKADTITAAYVDDEERSWVRETQYGIHRRVVKIRRSKSPQSLYDALGLMAYMKSFKAVVEELPRDAGKQYVEQYNLDETEDSIKATAEGRKWDRVQKNLILTAFPALLLGIAALLKTPVPGAEDSIFDSVRIWLSVIYPNNIKGVLAILATAILMPFVYGAVDITRLEVVQTAKRLAAVWPPRRQNTVWQICAYGVVALNGIGVWLVINGDLGADFYWFAAVGLIAFTFVSLVALPYIFTLPDLFKLVRTYPHRPDMSRADLDA